MRIFAKNLAVAVLAAGVAFTGFGGAVSTQAATPHDTLVQAFALDDIISLDPAEVFEMASVEIIANSYALLVRFNPDDPVNVLPELATDWSVSDDGLRYQFTLRDGVKFASGNEVTAEDVAFSFERVVKLDKSPSFLITQFGLTPENVTEKAKAIDLRTFELTVDQPYAPSFVLNVLTASVAAIVDKQFVLEKAQAVTSSESYPYDTDFGNDFLKNSYAGAGAYKIMGWRANESVVLEANGNFYGEKPKLKRVIYRHMKESSGQRLALQSGDIDVARNLEPGDVAGVAQMEGLTVTSALKNRFYYLGLNQKNALLANPKVREAIKYLVDYEGLEATILKSIGTTHQAFLPIGQFAALDEKPYSFNVEKAKQLLVEAGFGSGLDLTIDVRNQQPDLGVVESLQQTFAQAGIRLEILSGDGRQVLTRYRGRVHDIVFIEWGSDYDDPHSNTSAFVYNPDNSDNSRFKVVAWRNSWDIPELSARTEAALLEPDAAKREEIYQSLQREVLADGPYAIIFQWTEIAGLRDNVKDYHLGPNIGSNIVHNVYKID